MKHDNEKPSTGDVWIVAEQAGGSIRQVSFELLARAVVLSGKLSAKTCAMVFGAKIPDGELQKLVDRGAGLVVASTAPQLEHFLVEPYASAMLEVMELYSPRIIIAGATSSGRTLMPYVAAKADTGLTADCTELDIEPETGNLLQIRPAIGGNILATIKTPGHRPQMATVRPRSVRPAGPESGRKGKIVRIRPSGALDSRINRIGFQPVEDESNIQEADTVVTAGKGMKKADNIDLVYDLADALDGAVGATRDVVDRGWLSYPHQVGLSGKTVTPRLYVAAGVSGSIQHLAGMKTAENIISVNTDPEAQIFQVSDIGFLGDAMEVLPTLARRIREVKTGSENT